MRRGAPYSLDDIIAVPALLVALACAGCSSTGDLRGDGGEGPAEPTTVPARHASTNRAEADLQRGIRSYEDAEYESAARKLRSALDRGLKAPRDKATAHKYLAFVDCAAGRLKSCHAEFRSALAVDPAFKLAPAEAGHPVWGPVFRNAKLEVTGKAHAR